MCGLGAIFITHPPGATPPHPLDAIPESWLDTLDDAIAHRGPDGQGRFRDRSTRPDGSIADIALVHRRLSILDHAGGAQPMIHDGARLRPDLVYTRGQTPKLAHEIAPGLPLVGVVFNGCIYNHRDLRHDLRALGHPFHSDHSDTEVLIHGWRAWGDQLHDRLRDPSMYAALIWDRQRANPAVLRDFFGQRPLYLFHPGLDTDAPPLFGSPTPQGPEVYSSSARVSATLFPRLRPSVAGVAAWTRYGHHPVSLPLKGGMGMTHDTFIIGGSPPLDTPTTPPPPTTATTTVVTPPPHPRSTPRPSPDRRPGPNPRPLDLFDQLLRESVALRLEADVPVACLLSGGIDSSLVTAYARERAGAITTITVRMPDPRYDESEDAAQIAAHLGTRHVTVDAQPQTQPDAASDLVRLIEQAGLPFGDSSLLPTYWACRAARAHAKVLLTGDGGDEIFLGYERYFTEAYSLLLMPPTLLTWGSLAAFMPTRNPKSPWAKLARLILATRGLAYDTLLALFTPAQCRRLGFPDDLGRWDMALDTPTAHRDHDLKSTLPGDYLRKLDLASMAAGVEARAPFLDRSLLLAARAHHRLIARGRKRVSTAIARRYLPPHIINRPKRGFAIPISDWFRSDFGRLRQLLHDHLLSADPFPGLADADIHINLPFVRRMLAEHDRAGEPSHNPWHGRDHGQRLYMLLVLSIWARWHDRTRREGLARAKNNHASIMTPATPEG